MRKFVITSPRFKGQADIIYDDAGLIKVIDLLKTEMTAVQVDYFKQQIPLTVEGLEAGNGITPNMVVVEENFEVTFDMFWNKYDVKINRKRCEAIWARLSKADQVNAWAGISAYDKFLQRTDWRKKCDPETYFSKRYWENEWK